jgi:DNA (cytosine-5)-methyltransferase 1
MFRAIREIKPTWIVAENVPGLLTIEDGLVFERVCVDLEDEGYEVQPVIIPACATNADHRRDRIWIVAYSESKRSMRRPKEIQCENEGQDGKLFREFIGTDSIRTTPNSDATRKWRDEWKRENEKGDGIITNTGLQRPQEHELKATGIKQQDRIIKNPLCIRCDSSQPEEESEDGRFGKFSSGDDGRVCNESANTNVPFFNEERQHAEGSGCGKSKGKDRNIDSDASNNNNKGLEGSEETGNIGSIRKESHKQFGRRIEKREHWFEAATRLCIVDDGLSGRLDGITVPKWRKESLMAAGNAIVPQVAYEIFKAIQSSIPTGGAD